MKIALIHFAAAHKQPEKNLAELLTLNRKAAEAGATLILNTEMAVSGYSFRSREDIAPYTETDQGTTIHSMGALASEFGVFIGITFPERDPSTDIYYNAAFMIGPDGHLLAKYHKILTERRWARSGNSLQKGIADTPWGRIGMAICADSYDGLLARSMALKDVDLLWVPANWPTVGGLDPMMVWQARAMENGFYLAACNRTGKDLTLDCTHTVSCVFNPEGRPLFSGGAETSRVFLVDLPLDGNGRWANIRRPMMMARRNIDYYRPIYLKPWVENLTRFYQLPEPGRLTVCCYVPPEGKLELSELRAQVDRFSNKGPVLWILPWLDDDIKREALADIASTYQAAFAVAANTSHQGVQRVLISPDGVASFIDDVRTVSPFNDFPFKIIHYGTAAIAMADVDTFVHPELATVFAKLGCDLVVLSEKNISPENFLLSRIKALSGIAVAACANNGAQITGVQDMHFTWDQQGLEHPGVCQYALDTHQTRKKRFSENIDYDLLLSDKERQQDLSKKPAVQLWPVRQRSITTDKVLSAYGSR